MGGWMEEIKEGRKGCKMLSQSPSDPSRILKARKSQ